MENFNVNDNTGYLVILRYFKTILYRLDFSDTTQPYILVIFIMRMHLATQPYMRLIDVTTIHGA